MGFPSNTKALLASHAAVLLVGGAVVFGICLAIHERGCEHGRYSLLSPMVRCDSDSDVPQGEWDYEPLREQLLDIKNAWQKDGSVSELSVYFRDLDNGPRFGIGEYEKFHPASLRKVPVLIAFLHMADFDRTILDKTLSYSGSLKINSNVDGTGQTILPNTEYTVRELLEKMIVYSDNYSYELLTEEMNAAPPIIPYYTYRDLGVLKMMMDPKGDYISISNYATLFAVLYTRGYLSREMSQFGLELLSRAAYDKAIVAGVPPDVRVAHKFGQRLDDASGDRVQLHDCGIVYHPVSPYVLCVMTLGNSERAQQQAIAQISKTVYDAVTAIGKDARGDSSGTGLPAGGR